MTARMREGFGMLCVGLIVFLVGYVASSNSDGTTGGLFDAVQFAGGLIGLVGLGFVAWGLLSSKGRV